MGETTRNCRLCHSPMDPSPFATCATCVAESERVRQYILKNPYVTAGKIASVTGVPLEKVSKMVKLGIK